MRTVCGIEFHTDGAENWRTRLEKSVLVNGNVHILPPYTHRSCSLRSENCWRGKTVAGLTLIGSARRGFKYMSSSQNSFTWNTGKHRTDPAICQSQKNISTSRLATANKSRVSIPVNKILARAGAVVDLVIFSDILWSPCKIWLLFLILCAHVKGPKKPLARWYHVPLRYGEWLNPRHTHVLHLSYHAELGRCRSNRMGVSRGSESSKFLGRWAPPLGIPGHVWPHRNTPLTNVCHCTDLGRCRWNGWCVITDIIRESLILRVLTIKVTQGHWNRHGSIGGLRLSISVP